MKIIELVDSAGNSVLINAAHIVCVRVAQDLRYEGARPRGWIVALDCTDGKTRLQKYSTLADAQTAQEEIWIEMGGNQ